ncbi:MULTISPECIES: MATE family efflux transporter [unclassified Marinovum]
MLAAVTTPLIGVVDTGVVGQIPQAEPIAAVGVGAIILSAIYWIFSFLRMGTTGLTAQAAGQGNSAEVAALLTRSLMIGLACGVLVIVAQPLLYPAAFTISPASPEVEGMARSYMAIRIWSAPAAIGIFGISGWLIAQERTRGLLALQLWMNGANAVLDVIFVLGLGWGVNGVAIASFIAEWSGLAMGLWLCRAAFAHPSWRDWDRVFDRLRLRRMAAVNADIMIRSALLQVIFVSFLLFGGRFGDDALAANQVLLQFLYVTGHALDGFAFAAEALVGRAYGAGAVDRLRRSAMLTTFWAAITALTLSLVFWLFGPALINTLTKSPEVRGLAREFLPWMIAAPPMQIGLTMLDGIFIGATRSADMRNMMVLATLAYLTAVWLLTPIWANHGLWLALHVSFAARGLSLMACYPALERSAVAAAKGSSG